MLLYLLYPSKSGYALFHCYGLFKVAEKHIGNLVNQLDRFRKILNVVAYYQFDSTDQKQVDAIYEGLVTAELCSFLEHYLPKVEAGKKPEFSLGVGEPNLCSNIFHATNIPCLHDHFVLELLRGVELHINDILEFHKPNLELYEAPTESLVEEIKRSEGKSEGALSLLKYKLVDNCVVEDLKIGKQWEKAATLMDMVGIHYTVRRRKDDKMLLDTNNGDPFKFRLGTGQVIRALDMGICGMYVGGERRLTVPPTLGYVTKSGRGTIGVSGPKGACGHWLVVDVRLVDADF